MSKIDFDLPADLFWARSGRRVPAKGGIGHMRFATLAEAIRHAVEDTSVKRFSTSIDTDENSFSMDEINAVYASEEFAAYRAPSKTDSRSEPDVAAASSAN